MKRADRAQAVSRMLALLSLGLVACSDAQPSSVTDAAAVPDATASPDGGQDAGVPDASDAGPLPTYRMFLSAGTHSGAFSTKIVTAQIGGDEFCTTEAAAGTKTKPVGARVWRAFLSFGPGAAKVIKFAGPRVRSDGSPLGDLRPDGQGGPLTLVNPPNLDQNGQVVAGARVWVGGYAFTGLPLYPDCTFFTKTGDGALSATAGATADPSAVGPTWAMDSSQGAIRACQEQHHVYCVEDDD